MPLAAGYNSGAGYANSGPLWVKQMIEGLKASLEGVAISGRLLGPSTKPDGTLKFLKIEIAPTTEKKFLSVLVDGKEVNSNVTTPQYAIEFGRVPSVQHYEVDKYFLDKNGTVLHGGLPHSRQKFCINHI